MLPTLVTVFFLLSVTGSQVQSSDIAELALFYPNCSVCYFQPHYRSALIINS